MATAKIRKLVAGDGVRKSSTAVGVRKSDVSLEPEAGKSDMRSRVVGKLLVDVLTGKKAWVNSAQANEVWKSTAEHTIAGHVRRLRKSVRRPEHWCSSCYTQQEVADALCISRQAIVEIERGRRKLSAVELLLLAKFFDVSLAELLP